ncbi:MAG: TraM recognition domain-containing protein [Burkholderiales bacterium]|nr:TraM recognition domain-containing protein [Burkholderiales bacterium]
MTPKRKNGRGAQHGYVRENHPSQRFLGGRAPDAAIDIRDEPVVSQDHPWLQIVEPRDEGWPGIGLRRHVPDRVFQAEFALELVSFSGAARRDEERLHALVWSGADAHRAESESRRYLRAFFAHLSASQEIRIVHERVEGPNRSPAYRCRLIASSSAGSIEQAIAGAMKLHVDLQMALSMGHGEYGFAPLAEPPSSSNDRQSWRATVRPQGMKITADGKASIGYAASQVRSRNQAETLALLALPPKLPLPCLQSMVSGLLACPMHIAVELRLKSRPLARAEIARAGEAMQVLMAEDLKRIGYEAAAGVLGNVAREAVSSTAAVLDAWLARPSGFSLTCEVSADAAVPATFLEVLGGEVFQGAPCVVEVNAGDGDAAREEGGGETLDLRNSFHATGAMLNGLLHPSASIPLPPLLASTSSLAQCGFLRHFNNPRIELPGEGIVLGETLSQGIRQEVRFSGGDRTRHCYVMGATGAGKSTLLYNMIVQDILNGEGVGLIDPHGDLYRQVLESIPRKRIRDVILLDLADFDHAVGVNFLECRGKHLWVERNFIIGELQRIFVRLYGGVPEALGPAFQLYMRNAVALLMDDPDQSATLTDLPRVFEDPTYRHFLIEHCKDPLVVGFWKGIVSRTTGEAALANMAPYVVNKFTAFVYNRLMRPIVGQARSTIDFKALMDNRKILLVNLSKGLLGEMDSRFLGMILLGKLFAGCLARAIEPRQRRRPFYLYVDECQNFATDTLANMLAEARKYGLYLTLANQTIAQLPADVRDALLGNVGSMLFFRMGPADATVAECYLHPDVTAEDLVALPDRRVACRLLAKNVPTAPFVFQTRAPAPVYPGADKRAQVAADALAWSRKTYTRRVSDVEAEIAARRAKGSPA